jgi:undecaprenyl diphosphate synthase
MNNSCVMETAVSVQTPLHVAIIMDGSGRWATDRGLPRPEGHRAGREAVGRSMEAARDRGVRVLTLFTFSTDNWGRPETEVVELMRTFEAFFRTEAPALARTGIRISVIGRRNRLPAPLRDAIEAIERSSYSAELLHVRFTIDYSGRDAIHQAARQFQYMSDDSEQSFTQSLAEASNSIEPAPDVDLLIRTGGELRLSNCPLWEIAYAELHFTECLWPDFGPAHFDAALLDFSRRQRRFGRIPATL